MKAIYTKQFYGYATRATVLRRRPGAGVPKSPLPRLEIRNALTDDVPTALLAQCTCPDWCERDHDRD